MGNSQWGIHPYSQYKDKMEVIEKTEVEEGRAKRKFFTAMLAAFAVLAVMVANASAEVGAERSEPYRMVEQSRKYSRSRR